MGNSLGGKKSAKVMKISGETIKVKTPARAGSVLVSYPGHVLLESEAVKENGMRAKPLEPQHELKPRRLYFLVELPKVVLPPAHEDNNNNNNKFGARRVRSGIQMSAKDRLESLRLARRSSSDLSAVRRPPPVVTAIEDEKMVGSENGGGVRVRMRLPKAEVERLMAESQDGAEVAEKIARLCMENGGAAAAEKGAAKGAAAAAEKGAAKGGANIAGGGAMRRSVKSSREKRVGFMLSETEINQLTVAS